MYLCVGIATILYFFVIFPRVWYIFSKKTKKAPIRASFIHIFHGVPHLTGQPTGFFAAWLRLLSVLSTQGLEPRCNCRNRPRTKCIGFRGGGESNPRYANARYSPSSYHIRKKLYVIVPSEHGTKTMLNQLPTLLRYRMDNLSIRQLFLFSLDNPV